MNISQAKEINLNSFLERLGFTPAKTEANGEVWYCSPLRTENTPSFKISADGKAWVDFGESPRSTYKTAPKFASGSIIDFALHYWQLNPSDAKGALAHIREATGGTIPTAPSQIKTENNQTQRTEPSGLNILGVYEFSTWTGKGRSRNFSPQAHYLASRGLNPTLCAPYVHTVKFSGKKAPNKALYALGFKNDAGGYELRANIGQTHFKGVAGGKDISYIKPRTDSQRLHIFEGYPDFLTALHLLPETIEAKDEHFLILNSGALIERAKAIIEREQYSTLILWLQNDPAGREVEQFFLKLPDELPHLKNVGTMTHLCENEKDLNAWYQTQTNKPKINHDMLNSISWHQIGTASYDIFNRPKPM
jgi:hypothetical protein